MSQLFTYSIRGVDLRLRVDSPALLAQAERLHSCSCSRREECTADTPAELAWQIDTKGHHQLFFDGVKDPTPYPLASLYFLSEHRLTQLFAERLPHYLQLHAAGVIDPQGRAWLICGPSRAGKTSLTLALIMQGWNWLSDEYALIAEDTPGMAYGFPRNFNLKETSFPKFPETKNLPHSIEFFSQGRNLNIRFIDPLDIKAKSWRPEAPIHGLILPQWDNHLSENHVSRIAGLEAAQTLLGETANWQPWGLEVISNLCRSQPVFRFHYRDPRDLSGLLTALAHS